MMHAMPTTSSVTAEGVARLFRDNVWKLHGLPEKTLSDRGPQFASKVMKELNRLLGIKTATSTAYHPQTDGETELVNQEIEQYLRLFVDHHQSDWMNWLPMAEFAYNNRVQSATKYSPFVMNFGQNPRMGHEPRSRTKVESVEKFLDGMKRTREDAESALKRAAEEMKKYYDRGRGKTPVYAVGDKVWLDASNINTGRPMKKLDHKHLGPFAITKVLSNNAYELALPKSMKIHPVFNVVKLTPYIANDIPERIIRPPPPPIVKAGVEEFEIEEILDSRKFHGKLQYLVHWKGYPTEDNSWEPVSVILEDAPEIVHEFHDKHPSAVCTITSESVVLSVKCLSSEATLPTFGSEGAAGCDLYSALDLSIFPKSRSLIPIDIAVSFPPGHYGRIAPRSGLALKKSVDVAAGVIDPDYRGSLGVIIVNNTLEPFHISKGDRIAQFILKRISIPSILEVQELPSSIRDSAGFGSSGI